MNSISLATPASLSARLPSHPLKSSTDIPPIFLSSPHPQRAESKAESDTASSKGCMRRCRMPLPKRVAFESVAIFSRPRSRRWAMAGPWYFPLFVNLLLRLWPPVSSHFAGGEGWRETYKSCDRCNKKRQPVPNSLQSTSRLPPWLLHLLSFWAATRGSVPV